MINLLDLNKKETEAFFEGIGEKKFRAQQTREWLYRGARSFSGLIGQKELVKTAVNVEILTVTAVISFCRQDTGWTKRVGKNG